MCISMPDRPDDDHRAEVPENPGVDREPDEVWDFASAVADEDLSEHGRAVRGAVHVDPDALRTLDREAGQ